MPQRKPPSPRLLPEAPPTTGHILRPPPSWRSCRASASQGVLNETLAGAVCCSAGLFGLSCSDTQAWGCPHVPWASWGGLEQSPQHASGAAVRTKCVSMDERAGGSRLQDWSLLFVLVEPLGCGLRPRDIMLHVGGWYGRLTTISIHAAHVATRMVPKEDSHYIRIQFAEPKVLRVSCIAAAARAFGVDWRLFHAMGVMIPG